MGFLRKMAGMLGFTKDDGHEVKDNGEEDEDDNQAQNRANFQETGLPRKGFSVPVQVAVDRNLPGPVLVPCRSGDGGVQGLRWHAKRLRIDEDGDVADEFLDEVFPQMSVSTENSRALARFEVKYSTKPAKVRTQVLSPDGKIQQRVEYRGRSQWI
ncbi:hypothetical protein PRUPE_5G039100 [Prunus persica]|uniref:Uncharacterized protein n=1 Tax=Prunus persica TaxID=3760 RepID=M5WVW0_PRUPE|nr:uncharacterized protein LOC18776025 [Prunus persica]ONI06080.1 hypothetical protein PRUPE_5G039100 [Prunus persica]